MVENVTKDFIISKEDLKKYFNNETIVSKEKVQNYYENKFNCMSKNYHYFNTLVLNNYE